MPSRLGTTTRFGLIGVGGAVATVGTAAGVAVARAVVVGEGWFGVGVGGALVGVGAGAESVGSVPGINQSVTVGRPATGRKPVVASIVARTSPGGRLKLCGGGPCSAA